MQSQYQGKNVTVVNAVSPNDSNFDAATPQTLIRLADGTLKTVKDSEIVTVADPSPVGNPSTASNKQAQYQNAFVTVLRDAQQGDAGFDPAKKQSLIQLADGSQRVVLNTEITRSNLRPARPGEQAQYKGKNIDVLRDAQQGDQGYDATKPQSFIMLEDGSTKVVLNTEVTTV